MPLETATYRDRLLHNRTKAAELFPGREELNISQTAKLTGHGRNKIRARKKHYGFVNGYTTIEKISRAQSQEHER